MTVIRSKTLTQRKFLEEKVPSPLRCFDGFAPAVPLFSCCDELTLILFAVCCLPQRFECGSASRLTSTGKIGVA